MNPFLRVASSLLSEAETREASKLLLAMPNPLTIFAKRASLTETPISVSCAFDFSIFSSADIDSVFHRKEVRVQGKNCGLITDVSLL